MVVAYEVLKSEGTQLNHPILYSMRTSRKAARADYFSRLKVAMNATRKRVSGYSPEQRERLDHVARSLMGQKVKAHVGGSGC